MEIHVYIHLSRNSSKEFSENTLEAMDFAKMAAVIAAGNIAINTKITQAKTLRESCRHTGRTLPDIVALSYFNLNAHDRFYYEE